MKKMQCLQLKFLTNSLINVPCLKFHSRNSNEFSLSTSKNSQCLISCVPRKQPRFVFRALAEDEEDLSKLYDDDDDDEDDEDDEDAISDIDGEDSLQFNSSFAKYEHNKEIAEILLDNYDDPQKLKQRVEARIKAKQDIMMQAQEGSVEPMVVTFRNFDYNDDYIWLEFSQCPTSKDLDLILATIRSWYILGQLGTFNSQNLQLLRLPETSRPEFDPVKAAEKLKPGFYNIGDLELQDNIGRLWVDIGNCDPLLLDVLINSLQCLNSDFIGIKNLVFGGKSWGSWNEDLVTGKDGYTVLEI